VKGEQFTRAASHECNATAACLLAYSPRRARNGHTFLGWRIAAPSLDSSRSTWERVNFCPWCGEKLTEPLAGGAPRAAS
jgi:hypothetical protein